MLKTFPALAALALAAALVIPTVSQAAEADSVRVSYADLNLASTAGADVLQRRIAFAANRVCDTADPRDLNLVRMNADCREGAIAGAQPAFEAAVAAQRHGVVTVGAAAALVVSAR